ncbi:MAG: EAL domain-containing protein [Acidimicrobiales bacterium]
MLRRLTITAALTGGGVLLLMIGRNLEPTTRGTIAVAVAALAACVTVVVPLIRRTPARSAWISLAVSQVLFGLAISAQIDLVPATFAGRAAPLAMAALGVTAGILGRRATGRAPREVWIDSTIIAVSSFALAWSFDMAGASISGTRATEIVLTMAFGAIVLGLLVRPFMGEASGLLAPVLLSAGCTTGVIGLVLEKSDWGELGAWLAPTMRHALVWALAVSFLVLTAVTAAVYRVAPEGSAATATTERGNGRLSTARTIVVVICTAAVPSFRLLLGHRLSDPVVDLATAVLFVLVLFRVSWLMDVIDRSAQQLLHDPLTGLANRTLFSDRTDRALRQRSTSDVAVMFVDLDDFKTINDSLGHQAGDELLRNVATRLTACIRTSDTVARFGGDEFAVLLVDPGTENFIAEMAQRLLDAINQPMHLRDHEVQVAGSVGITVGTKQDDEVDSLLRNADVAMYLAKSKGKGRFEFFDRSMHEAVLDRLKLKADLQRALDDGQFEVHYQPIVDVANQRLESVEALLRWHHPERGLVPPDRFISLAEESGLIVPIGRWVLQEACRQTRVWQQLRPETADLAIGVNLSVRQMHDPNLIDDIGAALADTGLAPEHLTIELTESMLMEDHERSARTLRSLKDLGVSIAIDDFGTGYSSLSYLRTFPVDMIKIDKSFVDELTGDDTSELLVRTVVDLAEALGASAIAEGIESYDQFEILERLHCNFGQGYLISKPLTAAAMTTMLTSGVGTAVFELHPRDYAGRPIVARSGKRR